MYLIHPWLEKYPFTEKQKGAIIGTHPPMPYDGVMPFYYGNMNEFWRLLQEVYPNDVFFDENKQPKLESILTWLNKYHLGITDMVIKTYKNNCFSTDSQMIIDDPSVQLNPFLHEWLKQNTEIETLYFTSFSEGKSAYQLFKRWCRCVHLQIILPKGRDILLNGNNHIVKLFDRDIKLVMLYSPSPAARRGIPNSVPYIEWKRKPENEKRTIDDFRVWWYKKYLPKFK